MIKGETEVALGLGFAVRLADASLSKSYHRE